MILVERVDCRCVVMAAEGEGDREGVREGERERGVPEVVVVFRAALGEECSDDLTGVGSGVGVGE